jgi:hypothetical protein
MLEVADPNPAAPITEGNREAAEPNLAGLFSGR